MTAFTKIGTWANRLGRSSTRRFFEASQNGFALLGLAVMFALVALTVQPQIRTSGERHLMEWLQDRQLAQTLQDTGMVSEPDASDRATATDPRSLPKQQAALAFWLSKKYRVAPEPVSALVAEAFSIATVAKLEPTLILAIMAVESGFNPFAQSAVGAQGLMQVMTRVHGDKYENFGGKLAAFDPVSNLRVGVRVLQECIARAGSVEAGLRYYVGAANLVDDGGYASKVMAEHARLKMVAGGRNVPTLAPTISSASVISPTIGSISLIAPLIPAVHSLNGSTVLPQATKPKADAATSADKSDNLLDS